MEDLTAGKKIPVRITSLKTGEIKRLYYIAPTPTQVIAFRQAMMKQKKGKYKLDHATPTMRFGKEVLAGFDLFNLKENGNGELVPIEGDYAYGVGGVPMSSEPDSPHYRSDWKEILYNGAPLTVEVIGNVAFGGVKADDVPEAEDDDDGGEEPVPLEKN